MEHNAAVIWMHTVYVCCWFIWFPVGLLLQCKDGRPLSSRDRRNLQELEGKLQVLHRRGRHLEIAERNCCTRVGSALRPLKVSLHYGIDSHSKSGDIIS